MSSFISHYAQYSSAVIQDPILWIYSILGLPFGFLAARYIDKSGSLEEVIGRINRVTWAANALVWPIAVLMLVKHW